jgi:acetylornithine deacetylase
LEQPSQTKIYTECVDLLKSLISTPSFSKEEDKSAKLLIDYLSSKGIPFQRKGNNIWAQNKHFDIQKKTLLLNSHHDTVRPNQSYTRNPFAPDVENGKLFGLGSNDAGGALVCLLGVFVWFYDALDLPFNIVFAASAEEEISGADGLEDVISDLGNIDFAIVGEPTLLEIAVAERGLMVVDITTHGVAGHAARNEGVNAIYLALQEIEILRNIAFEKESVWLGKTTLNATIIQAGKAHNQVPDVCTYTLDIRLNEHYSHESVLEILKQHISSKINLRSERLKPSFIALDHPLILSAQKLGIKLYGSPTTSDQALMPWPSIKMGPGDSARSHSADEFIYLHEIKSGLDAYYNLIRNCFQYF